MSHENPTTMDTTTHHDHQAQFNKDWDKTQNNPYLNKLNNGSALFATAGEKQEFAQAFNRHSDLKYTLKCSDGRVDDGGLKSGDETWKTAGSHALLHPSARQDFVLKHKGRIELVTSHAGCGAAALKFKDMQAKGEALPEGVTTSDELGEYLAKQLAKELGAEHRHISHSELINPTHNERVLVIDGTGRFNANKIKDFPPRFTSAALGLGEDKNYVKEEAEILSGIALGDHGFGDRFTVENPFHILVIGETQAQAEEMKHLLTPFEAKMAGRVKLETLVAPDHQE